MNIALRLTFALIITPLLAITATAKEKIIDNGDPGYSETGFTSIDDPKSHNGSAAIVANPTTKHRAQFSPNVNGKFDVYLYWGDFSDKDTNVLWSVNHTKGITTHSFNQRNNKGWHFHGTYQLDADSSVDLHGRMKADAGMVADAVKFVPTTTQVFRRVAKDTITPITLNYGDALHFQLKNGATRKLKLVETKAEVVRREGDFIYQYKFYATLLIDDRRHTIERIAPAQESFYEPLIVDGMRIWLDAVSDIFISDGGFLVEKGVLTVGVSSRPKRKARLVVNDLSHRICPDQFAWWYPEKKDHIDIKECYRGEDVWMGPYNGKMAHGGLDINMKSGTPLFAPIDFDNHYLFDSLKKKDNNNRWRGTRKWDNGATWWFQAHHLNKMLVQENEPLRRGVKYAETAGVHIGKKDHTHFVFRIIEEGESYWIDPWILFWQTFRDNPTKPATDNSK